MPVRGSINPMPKAGKSPTGVFSTRGTQKMDSTSGFDHKDTLAHVRSNSNVKPVKRNNMIKGG